MGLDIWFCGMRRDIATRFKPQPDSFARTAIAVKLDKRIDAIVRGIPNRSEWLRRVITEAAERELPDAKQE